jgi:hypothetical protein
MYGLLLNHPDGPTLTVMRRIISLVQTHYRYENARRNRVYGKRVPNTRVDTSELADRVSTHYHLSGIIRLKKKRVHTPKKIVFDRLLASATLLDPVPTKSSDEKRISTTSTWYSIYAANGQCDRLFVYS